MYGEFPPRFIVDIQRVASLFGMIEGNQMASNDFLMMFVRQKRERRSHGRDPNT